MSFADENNRAAGSWKKLPHSGRHAGPGAVHQRFHFHAARERGFFRGAHRRGAYDRRFQSILRTFLVLLFPRLAALALLALAAAMRARGFRRTFPAAAKTLRRHAHKIVPER